mgnify:CR=1 FL=1
MKLDKLTVKAQEAIAAARDTAVARSHAEVRPEHLLAALLDQDGGVVPRILAKLGADPRVVRADLHRALDKLPRAHGAALDVEIGRAFKEVWEAAGRQAAEMKDEFLSTEHFLLALAASKTAAGEALFCRGDPPGPMYVVSTGRLVAIGSSCNWAIELCQLGQGGPRGRERARRPAAPSHPS